MLLCPAVETFTLATKVPRGKSIHQMAAPSSRLEYQTRNNIVHVRTTRKRFMDEKKQVRLYYNFAKHHFRRLTQMRKVPELMVGCCQDGVRKTQRCSRSVPDLGQWQKLQSRWVDLASVLRSTVNTSLEYCKLVLDYQFHQSARRLKEVFETAMSESSKTGMDYNRYV